jgi:hypothetical protein
LYKQKERTVLIEAVDNVVILARKAAIADLKASGGWTSESPSIDPNSAEGKAITRIADLDNTDEWETVYKPGEFVDLVELDRQIKELGY